MESNLSSRYLFGAYLRGTFPLFPIGLSSRLEEFFFNRWLRVLSRFFSAGFFVFFFCDSVAFLRRFRMVCSFGLFDFSFGDSGLSERSREFLQLLADVLLRISYLCFLQLCLLPFRGFLDYNFLTFLVFLIGLSSRSEEFF
jgi:hypothetical protein